jgi:hypothetical protein
MCDHFAASFPHGKLTTFHLLNNVVDHILATIVSA